jgi:tetratricopeptide (TPR) repeat protein
MKKISLLTLMLVSINVFGLVKINYPDLSNAKSAIKEYQHQLYSELLALRKDDSSYSKSEAYGKLGQFYHVHGYIDASIQLYHNAIELAPLNSKWYYLKAMAHKNKGDFDKAKEELKSAWKYNDQYIPILVQLGDIYLQEGNLKEAYSTYKKALKINKTSPRALVGMGQVLMQQGDITKAIENYQKAIKLQPYATKINFLISQAYAAKGDMKQAKLYNNKKGDVQAQMNDPLMSNLYKESRSMSYYNDKAVRAFMMGQYTRAESFAQTAQKYDPKSSYPLVTLANIYVSTGRAESAKKTLQKINVENEQDPNLIYTLGVIEEVLGRDKKAIHWYSKVLEMDPENKRANITLANALMRQGQYDKALKQLQKAQNSDSENAHLLHRMAAIYVYKNQCSLATTKIYEAIKLQPKSFAFLLTLVKIAVQCPVNKQMLEDALNAARNMYQISQDTYVVEVLAMIEAKNNNFKEAIDYQAQAIYQILLIDKDSNKIKELKANLELYKAYKYPQNLFKKSDIDLYPKSFGRVN